MSGSSHVLEFKVFIKAFRVAKKDAASMDKAASAKTVTVNLVVTHIIVTINNLRNPVCLFICLPMLRVLLRNRYRERVVKEAERLPILHHRRICITVVVLHHRHSFH